MDIQPALHLHLIRAAGHSRQVERITTFLQKYHIQPDADIEFYAEALIGKQLAGCAGLAGNIIKCVVTDLPWRGSNLTARLMAELEGFALRNGIPTLFLCTCPANIGQFRQCGFWPIAQEADRAVLMENNPVGLQHYCRQLTQWRQPGEKVAAIVMNANPFTLGHQFLAERAARECDWLHLFLVGEEGSFFSYADRLAMVTRGVAHLHNVTVHGGSPYIISRATFPAYFLKETPLVDQAWCAIDVTLFRDHIAPALGITHRYIGSEPFCPTTRRYNETIHTLLAGAITVTEVPRITSPGGKAISASEVRRLLAGQHIDRLRDNVPPTTFSYLEAQFIAQPVSH